MKTIDSQNSSDLIILEVKHNIKFIIREHIYYAFCYELIMPRRLYL